VRVLVPRRHFLGAAESGERSVPNHGMGAKGRRGREGLSQRGKNGLRVVHRRGEKGDVSAVSPRAKWLS